MRNVSSMKKMINIVKGMFLDTKVHYVPGIQITLIDREQMAYFVEEALAKMMLNRKGCSVLHYPMKDSKGNTYGDFVILQDAHMIAVDEIFVSNDISIVELIQMMEEMGDYVGKSRNVRNSTTILAISMMTKNMKKMMTSRMSILFLMMMKKRKKTRAQT